MMRKGIRHETIGEVIHSNKDWLNGGKEPHRHGPYDDKLGT